MKKFGLIGYPLGHSFSKKYYQDKIDNMGIEGIGYDLYPIPEIRQFPELYKQDRSFHGFNVTIPYKQDVMAYIDELSDEARQIGAVNCITIAYAPQSGIPHLKGFNTDAYGFEKSLLPQLDLTKHDKALILGNGGASKAVAYTLTKLGVRYHVVSRTKTAETLSYQDLDQATIESNRLIINCSPVGTFPDIMQFPDIPYQFIGADHYLYDLIYNPEETLFLQKGKEKGAKIKNGYDMLIFQAEQNWKIWGF